MREKMIREISELVEERTGAEVMIQDVRKNNGLVLTGFDSENRRTEIFTYGLHR